MAMMLVTVVHSVGRYALNQPIPGTIEIARLLMVIVAFMLAGYTQARKGHITIPIIVERFSQRGQAIVNGFTYLILLVLAIIGAWQSVEQGIFIGETGTYTPVLHIPFSPFYFIVTFGWAVIALVVLLQVAQYVLRAIKK